MKDVGAGAVSYDDVRTAQRRIAGRIRPVVMVPAEPGSLGAAGGSFAVEFGQYTGSFKARGAANFIRAHVEAGTMPPAGVVIASGGNAGLACAWAASSAGVPATVFLPTTAPAVKVARLATLGATVRQVGSEYAEALDAAQDYSARTGAVQSHAYDHPLIAAGAGTLMEEIAAAAPDLDTVLLAVGGGGLFSGVAVSAAVHGVKVVAVEPAGCCALHAAVAAGQPVDVPVTSVAADSLGARRASAMAVDAAGRPGVDCVLVDDDAIVAARRHLWHDRRMVVEHGAATALAALRSGAYRPARQERVAVILCGANTDPTDLATS